METSGDPRENRQIPDRQELLARLRDPRLRDTTLPIETDLYLRRNPDDEGFQFWLKKLNEHGGDFRAAEMVKSFIVSEEYKRRFGPFN